MVSEKAGGNCNGDGEKKGMNLQKVAVSLPEKTKKTKQKRQVFYD